MFKKFKDKLAEEMKQSPARLQASMQQLAQAVVSPALSNSSIQELSTSNDNFSLTEEGEETPKNSPAKHGFQNVDLMSPIPTSVGISRRSSISSITSDNSSLFPIYESPTNLYHLQSDMDQSASEIDENINSQLDKVTKDQIYSAYIKVQAKYHKYRGRYTDLANHYRELERAKGKLESVLVETQDKVLRRVADLKEQCQLEQQAKAHLEEALRNDIEEKDHIINTLNTKIKLLQTNGSNSENTSDINDHKENSKDNLIDLNTDPSNDSNENVLLTENAQVKEKLKKLENVVLKYKESLKRNKEKFTELLSEKNTLESDYETLKTSYARTEKELSTACSKIENLTEQINSLKKREEESAISLAENKLSIHRELEDKEEQIKQLQLDLKHMTEAKDNFSQTIDKYKKELEKLKSLHASQNLDSEKREVIQDISRGKSEALKLMQQEMQQKLINLEQKMGSRYHEEVDRNKELVKGLEKFEKENVPEKNSKLDDNEIQSLISQLDEKENKIQEMKIKLEELQKMTEEYKQKCTELRNEQDAQRIITEEKKKEADITIEKLQATIQSLDKELENMRSALVDRDKVCENYNIKIAEYAAMLEKAKEKVRTQDIAIKSLKDEIQDNTEINKLNDELENKNTELLGLRSELKSCKSTISDLRNKIQTDTSNIDVLRNEKSNLIKNILNYKNSLQKLKEDSIYVKDNVLKDFTEFNNEVSVLKNALSTYIDKNSAIQSDEVQASQIKLKELEDFREKYDALQTELKNTVNQKSKLESDLKQCNEKLNDMTVRLEEFNEVDVKNRKLIAEIDNLNFKLYNLRNLPEEIETLKAKYASLEEDYACIKITNTKLSNEILDLIEQLKKSSNISEELETLNQKYMLATETITSLKSENSNYDKLQEEAKSLKLEIKNLKEHLCEKDEKLDNFNEQLTIKENLIINLQTEIENYIKLIDKQEKDIAELTDSNKTFQETKQSLEEQLRKLKAVIQKQGTNIQKLNDEINEVQLTNSKLLQQLADLQQETVTIKERREALEKENEQLHNKISELNLALGDRKSIEEKNKELEINLQTLEESLARLKFIEEESNGLKLELSSLNEEKLALEKVQLQNNELINEQLCLKNKITELENVRSTNAKLQSYVNNLESKVSSLEQVESKNIELSTELEKLTAITDSRNVELTSQIKDLNVNKEQLLNELDELKHVIDEKVAELKLLDTRNTDLLKEIERLKSSTVEDESAEIDSLRATIEHLKDTIMKQEAEIEQLKESNTVLHKEMQNVSLSKPVDDSLIKMSNELQEVNKKLEAQLDEALITFQAKESQMQIVNNELKNQADKLREELKVNEEEQSMRLKQLVKEFQAQLHDKEEELHAALEKRFDRQQNYESNLIQEYKEQLKDFQIELTTKSEQIENLLLENKNLMAQKAKDINQLMENIALVKKEHANEIREVEKKWKAIVQQKTDKLEAKHEEEINELTREWRNERRPDIQIDSDTKDLESTSRVAMAAVQSNTGSFHTLQQTVTAQRRELAELRKLIKLRHDTLEDSTEIEYLRNILFEYMMGKETMVLARVIAAVVKFDQDQTAKILKKEEDKLTLLGSLGLT